MNERDKKTEDEYTKAFNEQNIQKPIIKKEKLWINPLNGGKIRNKGCICLSGKKIKRCCGRERIIVTTELNRITRMIKDLEKAEMKMESGK